MSLLPNSQNTTINGGNFSTVQGDVYVNPQVFGAKRKQRGFELLQRYIAQDAFHDSLARADPPRCHPLTRHAVLDVITDWILNPDANHPFLWSHGPAGGGKTAIAQTIAEMFASVGRLAASFFFSRIAVNRNDITRFIPTLAYQLALYHPEIHDDVGLAVERDPSIFSRTLMTQIQALVVKPFNAAAENPSKKTTMLERQNLVVLDGLDECGDARWQREVLEALAMSVKQLSIPLLFLITSRPEHQIRLAFSKGELESQTLVVPLDETFNPDDDIRIYLKSKFNEIKQIHPSGPQLPSDWPSDEDLRQIIRKSSGQFIYPATAIKFVESSRHHPVKRLKVLLGASEPGSDSPFTALDALYHQLFLTIENLDGALDLLTLLVLQDKESYYLTVNFSEEFLDLDEGEVLTMLSDLHAFVHVPKPKDLDDPIHILHDSLPDFLFDKSRSGRFFIDPRNGHAKVTAHWIEYVQRQSQRDHGPRTVVQPRGYKNVIITIERIIEHCMQAHLTDSLLDALFTLNLEAHMVLYAGVAFSNLIQQLFSFIEWLKTTASENHSNRGADLYHHYLGHIDRWIHFQLSQFPDDIRKHLPVAFVFENQFSSSPGALYDILSHKITFTNNTFEEIGFSNENKDFWFICQEFGGNVLFEFLKDFFTDPSRSGIHCVDEKAYAGLAVVFSEYLSVSADSSGSVAPWSYHKYHHISGNRYKSTQIVGPDDVLVRAASGLLPVILSKCANDAALIKALQENALQLKSTDKLHDKKLEAAIASLEYLKRVDFSFHEHVHKPDHDICVICLFQPGAFQAPHSDPSPQRVPKISPIVPLVSPRQMKTSYQLPVPSIGMVTSTASPTSQKEMEIVPRVSAEVFPWHEEELQPPVQGEAAEPPSNGVQSSDPIEEPKKAKSMHRVLIGWFKRSWSKGRK